MRLMQAEVVISMIGTFGAIIVAAISAISSRRNRKNAIDEEFKKSVTGSLADIKQEFPVVLHRINALEAKQDASNAIKERLARNEESTRSAHKRIDGIKG